MEQEKAVFGAILVGDFPGRFLDQLSGGALTRYFWLSGRNRPAQLDESDEEEIEYEKDRLNEILAHINDPWRLYASEVLLENRYDNVNGVYLAMFNTLFLVLEGVLTNGARLVLALPRGTKGGNSVAFDVFENGCPDTFFSCYTSHFPTTATFRQAKQGFSKMACTSIVTSLNSLPWRKNLPVVRQFLNDARLNGIYVLGSNPGVQSYDICAINELRKKCEKRRASERFNERKKQRNCDEEGGSM